MKIEDIKIGRMYSFTLGYSITYKGRCIGVNRTTGHVTFRTYFDVEIVPLERVKCRIAPFYVRAIAIMWWWLTWWRK